MKETIYELLKVVKELAEILISPPVHIHWNFFAELLCDIETLLFCIEMQNKQTFRSLGDTFSKKAVMLLTLQDSELVDAIARSMISEECSKIVTAIQDLDRGHHLYI